MVNKKEYINSIIQNGRQMLKPDWDLWNYKKTDAGKGLLPPEIVKDYDKNCELIPLKVSDDEALGNKPLTRCIKNRKSSRDYSNKSLSIDELSFLLWGTGGIIKHGEGWSHRTVPSAGARHCLETYVFANKVSGISEGLYRYLPVQGKLLPVISSIKLKKSLEKAMFNQMYDSAATIIWTALPYRMEYRYSAVSHKMIAFEAGHACQNLYLASESIDCGCCAISAYNQKAMDKLVNVDGENEFVIYMAVVGKK